MRTWNINWGYFIHQIIISLKMYPQSFRWRVLFFTERKPMGCRICIFRSETVHNKSCIVVHHTVCNECCGNWLSYGRLSRNSNPGRLIHILKCWLGLFIMVFIQYCSFSYSLFYNSLVNYIQNMLALGVASSENYIMNVNVKMFWI